MTQTISAKAMCEYCDWSAKATGDDALEVATFLRRLCIEHTEEQHAEEHNHQVAKGRTRREGA